MNFIAFSVDTTNIFPMSNSRAGGQNVTEFNLRSAQSVETSESIEYLVGKSFAHSESDFYVQLLGSTDEYFGDGSSVANSGAILEVTAGRAVVNGYFIESLVPVSIDLAELAQQAISAGNTPLSGNLAIGLKVMFSTEATVAGSIKVENSNDMYEGIQIIILPENQFITPEDSPTDQTAVTAHLKLATFSFINGQITNIENNYPAKCQSIPASRIGEIDTIISDSYIKKTGLNPKRLYVYSGKSSNPDVHEDTWCDATNALFNWSNSIPQYVGAAPLIQKAAFTQDPSADTVDLILPHKQIDGMKDAGGAPQYFAPEVLPIPAASFEQSTQGVVSKAYTEKVKGILNKLNEYYHLSSGKQRMYLAEMQDRSDLPAINDVWTAGDYVLVAKDYTIDYATGSTVPSTLYAVVPGNVLTILYSDPQYCTGVELDHKTESAADGVEPPDWWDDYAVYNKIWDLPTYNGNGSSDYFVYEYIDANGVSQKFYYIVSKTGQKHYSDPIILTGDIPLADIGVVGGFMNVDQSDIDRGYVYLDSDGHLRLLDYGLIRSGTAAYQLGEDFTIPTGLDIDGIQQYLDEYVNQRIAFPNNNQLAKKDPNIIHIFMEIPADASGELTIYDIDSRFSTCIYLHILGAATNAVTINIADCERIRIDSSIAGSPVINLYRSGLYYDSAIMDYLTTIKDLKLWYERQTNDDPNLTVNDLTVSQVTASSIYSTGTYATSEYWDPSNPNDNHFLVALQSVTFGSDGTVIGCGVFVRNESTSNVSEGNFVMTDTFTLPVGPGLMYPTTRMSKSVKVTGQFVSAYVVSTPSGYMIQDTEFSLATPIYDANGNITTAGNIAFLVKAYVVQNANPTTIDVWDTGAFHYFEGRATI